MIDAPQLAKAFGRNTAILTMQTAGLSHTDSLLQTPYNINCLNWTLGHILVYRDRVLTRSGASPQFESGELDRYRRESEPIEQDGPGVLSLDHLVSAIESSQEAIDRSLGQMDDEVFATELEEDGRTITRAALLHFDYFHDTYHTGQTEILRQVAGTDDKII